MRRTILLLFLLILAQSLIAQDLGSFSEATAGNFFGIGARQMSMGGVGIASSLDGAAIFYNPAALSRLYRIEVQGNFSYERFSNSNTQAPSRYATFTSLKNSASGNLEKYRFGSLNLGVPVPVYRGSFVVAAGIHRIASFDRISVFQVIDRRNDGLLVDDYATVNEKGGIYLYTAAAAIDLTPHISVGLALNIYSGDDNFKLDYSYTDETTGYYEYGVSNEKQGYIGAGAKGGVLIRPNSHLLIGLVAETPVDYQVEYDFVDEGTYYDDSLGGPVQYTDELYKEYDLTHPYKLGGGFAVRVNKLEITGDIEYVPWSRLQYNDNASLSQYNDSLAYLYRDVVNLRGGVEYQIPKWDLALRAGVFSNPLPYRDEFIEDDRLGFSFGAGYLIEHRLLVESAYLRGSLKRVYTESNGFRTTADDTFNRIYVTVSYRY